MPGGNRSRGRELAALAVASGKTNAEIALAAGVCEKTICNWLNDVAFKARVSELRSRVVSSAASKLAGAMSRAADALVALLDSASEDTRRHAAAKIIELGLKVVELEELQKQVAELERRCTESEARCAG